MSSPPISQLRGADFFTIAGVPISVFRVPSEGSYRHSHDFCELVLVSKGSAHHELFAPDSDTPAIVILNPGSLFLVPLGWSHSYRQIERLEIFNVLFEPELLQRWLSSDSDPDYGQSSFESAANWMLQRSESEYLETLLQTIMRELTGRQRGFELAVQAKFAEMLVWIDRLSIRQQERRTPEAQLAMTGAVAFIEQHFAEPISLEDMARTAHLSSHYFCEVFKNATGLSPGRYLLRLRLEHARFLLLTSTKPVTQIAREAGFADASYFARAFKASFGTAPSRLRSTGR